MAFSSTEADKCKIKKVNKIMNSGAFVNWFFHVVDGYGRVYQWEEKHEKLRYILAPTDAQVRTYIHSYLTGGAYGGGGGTFDGVTQTASQVKENIAIPRTRVINQTVSGDPLDNLDPPT
tara:strand:- start:9236 stop:9592 length:357 start_codon:yes stop_codon:yes gene_type:complete